MTEKKKIVKKLSKEKIDNILNKNIAVSDDPDQIIEDFGNLCAQYYAADDQEEKEALIPDLDKRAREAVMVRATESHVPAMETAGEGYRALVKSMIQQFKEEHKAETSSEIALVQIAALEYVRAMEFGKELNSILHVEFLSHEKNGYYSLLARQIDRAERRMMQALTSLKQMKQPPMTLSFKADTAFVAHNQQVNATKQENDSTNEKSITP